MMISTAAGRRRGLQALATIFALLASVIVAAPAAAQAGYAGKLPQPADATRFGFSIAMSSDGDLVVIGAPGNGALHDAPGHAYVYARDGASYSRIATLEASDATADDGFGTDVAIDGEVIVVGAANAHSIASHAYVFVRPDGGWSGTVDEAAILAPTDADAPGRFGNAVAVDGNVVAVGDQRDVFVYVKPAAGWAGTLTEHARLVRGPSFPCIGGSIAIDGTVIVTGEPNAAFACEAAVFNRPLLIGWTGSINPSAILTPPDDYAIQFGQVDMDGETIVVGAADDWLGGEVQQEGAAYVFLRPGDTWAGALDPVARLRGSSAGMLDHVGADVDIEGDTVVVGTRSDAVDGTPGDAVYVFERPSGGWSGDLDEAQRISPPLALDAFHLFGSSVATGNGQILAGDQINGSPGNVVGAVYAWFPDAESDGIPDVVDNCPADSNRDQQDTDGDGSGNACDADDDADGVGDGADNCPLASNAGQDDADADSIGDACDIDDDGDNVGDASDNCPAVGNPDQADADADAAGDACDPDDDNDTVVDADDSCPLAANPNQFDMDADGIGDRCDTSSAATIDVMPGVATNPVRTAGKVVPVAILSTPGFDVTTRVNADSLRFGHAGSEAPVAAACRVGDVNDDGLADLTCDFAVRLAKLGATDVTAVLTGRTVGPESTSFSGSDTISMTRAR